MTKRIRSYIPMPTLIHFFERFRTRRDRQGSLQYYRLLRGRAGWVLALLFLVLSTIATPTSRSTAQQAGAKDQNLAEVLGVKGGMRITATLGIPTEDETTVGFELMSSLDGQALAVVRHTEGDSTDSIAATFIVTNTNDGGAGSLRKAISDANANQGADTITFNIPGPGPHSIRPTAALPNITDQLIIDGYTQPGASEATVITPATLKIELDGSGAGAGANGLTLMAANCLVKGLVINRFSEDGIALFGANHTVRGNYIGTDVAGTADLGNGRDGVAIIEAINNTIGGNEPAARNIISGNDRHGVSLAMPRNQVLRNYIGTDVSGTAALGNSEDGVFINAPSNTIGGMTGGGNVIAGNGGHGVHIESPRAVENSVWSNFIGTNGDLPLPNASSGVFISGGAAGNTIGEAVNLPVRPPGNVIAGNGGHGIEILGPETSDNLVQGNLIGGSFGNRGHGVLINRPPNNVIGDRDLRDPKKGNEISGNGGDGVRILGGGAFGNWIAINSIFDNEGLGIDLGGDGVTANDLGDADTGPNRLQNFPELLFVLPDGTVTGTINSTPNTALKLDFYSSPACDPSGGFGEGKTFFFTSNVQTDDNGDAVFTLTPPPEVVPVGLFITAIAYDPATEDFSEFSRCIDIITPPPPPPCPTVVTNTNDSGPGSLRSAIECANANPGADTVTFNIPGPGVHTITPISALPTITDPVTINGYSQPGSSPNTNPPGLPNNAVLRIELNGSSAGAGADGLQINAENSVVRGLIINRFSGQGISLQTGGGNIIEGNFIGTDATGTANLGNAGHGVLIDGSANNRVGGNLGNLIRSNGGAGIAVIGPASDRNAILRNSILANDGLGIDLGNDGVTPNDPGDTDTGANGLQNFPELTAATATSGSTTIRGTLNSTPDTRFILEFFANTACDPSNHGEGENLIGIGEVTTNATGDADFAFTFPIAVPEGQFITATATDSNNNTSEFSQCRAVVLEGDPPPSVGFDVISSSGSEAITPANLAVSLSAASGLPVTVNYAVTGGTAIGGGVDYTLANGTLIFNPGQTTRNIQITIINDTLDEADETIQVTLSNPTNAILGAITVHTYTILDNDDPPSVAFVMTASSGSEATSPANLAVSLSAASGKTVMVNYAATGGTATGGGVDYTLANGTLTFNPGQTTRNISITIIDDTLAEPNETIQVTLSNPVNATLGINRVHTYTILDNDNSGPFRFAFRAGSSWNDRGYSIATDANANVYVTGQFEGTVDFDPGPATFNLTSAGGLDIFVAKYSSTGALVWARRLGGSDNEEGRGIAIDNAGNVHTTGIFSATADFDPGPGTFNLISAGGYDVFVSKLNSAGNFIWARRLGGGGSELGRGIAIDNAGNVHTTGDFSGTADFDPGPGTFNLTAGGFDVFVSKLNSAGNFVWAARMGGSGDETGWAIALDNAGNVHTTGYFAGTADFDPGPGTFNLTSAGSFDIFVSKLNSAGNFVWAGRMGGGGADYESGLGIAIDNAGNVYTTGYFAGTADFDPGPGTFNLTSPCCYNIFVSKLNNAGSFLWAGRMGGVNYAVGLGIAIDNAGNVYTTGSFIGTADFDPGPGAFNLSSAGGWDIFVSKLIAP